MMDTWELTLYGRVSLWCTIAANADSVGGMMQGKHHPQIGVCGIDCCLCPMHHVRDGEGCPGCTAPPVSGGRGRWCAIARCAVRERGFETCADCAEFPCERLGGIDECDSFVTHRLTLANLQLIRDLGMERFLLQQEKRAIIVRRMLDGFDDGRSKSRYCLASALLPIETLEMALADAGHETSSVLDRKGRARILRRTLEEAADRLGIDLNLRR